MRGQLIKNTYRIERTIGEGGMGAVYEVTQIRTGRRYALKVIRPEALGPRANLTDATLSGEIDRTRDNPAVARFRREADALGRLRHANVISIHNFDELDGGAFIVMDLLEGEDLRERLAREPRLAMQDALRIFTEVAAGLEAAHQAGIIHRDLKPANVFLARQPGADERAVVIDFGLAKEVSSAETTKLTTTGIVMGTPEYMSLEQASGLALDERADLYALATILFEMLIGHTPFYAPTLPALFTRLMTEPPPSLRRERPELPPRLDAVMARALAKSRDERYPSARALADAVRAAFEGEADRIAPTAAMPAEAVRSQVAPTDVLAAPPITTATGSRSRIAPAIAATLGVLSIVLVLAGIAIVVSDDREASRERIQEHANHIAHAERPSVPDPPLATERPREVVPDAGSCETLLGCTRSCDAVFESAALDESFRSPEMQFTARGGTHETTAEGLALGGGDRLATIRSVPRFSDEVMVCIEAHLPRTLPEARRHEAVFSLRNTGGAGISLVLRGTDRRIGLLNMRPFRPIERQDCPWLGEERDVRILISLRNHRLYLEVQRVDTGETQVLRTAYLGPATNLFVELEMAADQPLRVDRVRAGSPSPAAISFLR